jgi:hypothetical protein
MDYVHEAWAKHVPSNQNPYGVLHIKLTRTAKALRKWAKKLVPQGKLAMDICREVSNQLEKAQEHGTLSAAELSLLKTLKARIIGLAAIHKSKAR